MRSLNDIEINEIITTIKENKSICSVLKKLNVWENTANSNKLKKIISDNNIDISHFKIKSKHSLYIPKFCKKCGKIIPYEKRLNNFCSHSCANSFNNMGVAKNIKIENIHYCLKCNKKITKNKYFCSQKCKNDFYYQKYIEDWKNGKETGTRGRYDISLHIRRYLMAKYENKCQICGWNKCNQYTGLIPLHIHHIDGDCTNNKEENLQLLCPNCHSLTNNYGSSNKNATRVDTRKRY